jgi:hypothetical protein
MWVDSIVFTPVGKNLRLDIKVVGDAGAVPGAQMGMTLVWSSGLSWTFSGTTDSSGMLSFTLQKAAAGDYVATVTSLTTNSYTWDVNSGIISASYTLNGSTGKPIRR